MEQQSLRLTVLGDLSLAGNGRDLGPATSQPRRLALLSILAVAGARGVPRDRLLLLLWPDSDTKSARDGLKQAVFALRRDTHAPGLIEGTTDLRLNPDLLSCDLWEFDTARAAGDLVAAARTYGGPFLDGVHVDHADEFDPWVEAERERIRQSYAEVLETLAGRMAAAGDHQGAAAWWRRLATLEPLNTRIVRELIEALSAGGDRGGALGLAEEHQRALESQLGVARDAELASLVESIRTGGGTTPARRPAPTSLTGESAERALLTTVVAATDQHANRRSLKSRWGKMAAAGVLVAGAVVALRPMQGAKDLDVNLVAVMPFRVAATAPELRALEGDVPRLFWMKLPGDFGPRAADPGAVEAARRRVAGADSAAPTEGQAIAAAREIGAGRAIVGLVSGTPTRVELDAHLEDASSGAVLASYSVTGSLDSIAGLVDQLATSLIAAGYGTDPSYLPSLRHFKSAAVREFLTALRPGDAGMSTWGDAAQHFRNAVRDDSTFVLAAFDAYELGETDDSLARWAWAHRSALSERDQALLRALAGKFVVPGWAEADKINALEELSARYPDWGIPQYELANAYLNFGPFTDRTDWEPRARGLYELLLNEPPRDPDWAEEMLEATASANDTPGVRRAAIYLASTKPAPADAWFTRWRVARFFDDQGAVDRIWSVLDTLPAGEWIGALYGIGRIATVDGRGLSEARHALARLAAVGEPLRNTGVGWDAVEFAAGHYGTWLTRRNEWLGTLPPQQASEILIRDALFAGVPEDRSVNDAARSLARIAARPGHSRADVDAAAEAQCWLSLWQGARDSGFDIERAARAFQASPYPQRYAICDALLALDAAHRRGGDVRAAALRADSITSTAPMVPSGGPLFGDLNNLVIARALLAAGEPARALTAARRRCRQLFCGWRRIWPSQILAEARAALMTGDTLAAVRAYDHYMLLRGGAEGPWRSELDSAVAERARAATALKGR